MFERFTPEARRTVVEARARGAKRGRTGTEHLLLAVSGTDHPAAAALRERGAGPAAVEVAIAAAAGDDREALATLGIDLDEVRRAVEASFGAGALEAPAGRRRRRLRCEPAPFTPRAKRCLQLALREAIRAGDGFVGPEHLVLALVRTDDTAAWRVLDRLGVDQRELRSAVEAARRRPA